MTIGAITSAVSTAVYNAFGDGYEIDIAGTPHDGMLTVTALYDGFVLREEDQTEMQSVTPQTSAKE